MAKLLYFISEDWFFRSHFFDRAAAARDAGHDVVVLTRVARCGPELRAAGFRLIALQMDRSGVNVFRELGVLRQVWRTYRAERPDLVHQVALKPIVYGSLAAQCLGIRAVLNAPVGMGYAFTVQGAKGRVLRALVGTLLRWLMNPAGSKVVFENEEDLAWCVRSRCVRPSDGVLIPGAGVDTDLFRPGAPPTGPLLVVMGSRMLREKGVFEFVEAARILAARGVPVRCVLAGAPDPENPSSVPRGQLERWHAEGVVEWLGYRDDMADVLRQCHIACLPSYYREGLPKFLLEAMACGLPIVTTDATGCRQAVEAGVTGLLIPTRDVPALVEALQRLVNDGAERMRMGAKGRERALREFDRRIIARKTLAEYQRLAPVAAP